MTQLLKQSTAVDVLIGPFVDKTDAATAETGESPSVKLSKNGQTLAAKNDVTTPVHDADGYYNCELDATDTNTVGTMILTVAASANALPVRHEFQVVEEDTYEFFYASGSAPDTQIADILTDTGTTLPATLKGLVLAEGTLGATGNTTTTLHLSGFTYADDEIIGYTLVVFDNSESEYHRTYITDWVLSTELATVPTLAFTPEASVDTYWLLPHTSAGGVWDEVLSGATHNVTNSAGRRLRQIQEAGGYSGGFIYIDTVNGAAGTTNFENGVETNPVDNIADANTLASSLGISQFRIAPGSSITFSADQTNQRFEGLSWTLDLNTVSIDGSSFEGAVVSGVGTNVTGVQYFINCHLGAITIPGDTHLLDCHLAGTTTLGEEGDYFFDGCFSAIAGTSTPTLDFGGASNASNVSMRHYSGGIEIQNMGNGTGSYTMSLEGEGQLVINANCSATSTVSIRGNFTVTDNAGGAVTLSDDARIDVAQVNAQVLDVLNVDTFVESAGVPAATATLVAKIGWLCTLARNKLTQTSTTQTLRNDADSGDVATATVSDDGSTATRGEWT